MTEELREAMRHHRLSRDFYVNHIRQHGYGTFPKPNPFDLDAAHIRHWYALQDAGIPAGVAGDMCAAISQTRLPK